MPPVPGFYSRPQTIEEIVNHTVTKMLDHVLCVHFAKRVRRERPWHDGQVMNDIRTDLIADVEVHGALHLPAAAAKIEHTLIRHGRALRTVPARRIPE